MLLLLYNVTGHSLGISIQYVYFLAILITECDVQQNVYH